jgi:CheY-like chemotaxis protein
MTSGHTNEQLLILLVDDDPAEYTILKRKLSGIETPKIDLEYVEHIGAAVDRVKSGGVDLVFLDNRLVPNNDFRETAPQLRKAGFVGPIGIISSDISGSYFREFREFGVDFRIGKEEIDASAISFIVAEFTRNQLSETCAEDFQ